MNETSHKRRFVPYVGGIRPSQYCEMSEKISLNSSMIFCERFVVRAINQ